LPLKLIFLATLSKWAARSPRQLS